MFQQFSQIKGLNPSIGVLFLLFGIVLVVFQVLAEPLPEEESPAATPTPVQILAAPVPTTAGTAYPSVALMKPDEAQIRQAMDAVLTKQLAHWGAGYRAEIGTIQMVDGWAYSAASWQSQTQKFEGAIHILARQLPNGRWQALLPDTEGLYLQWLEQAPADLLAGTDKAALYEQAALNSRQ